MRGFGLGNRSGPLLKELFVDALSFAAWNPMSVGNWAIAGGPGSSSWRLPKRCTRVTNETPWAQEALRCILFRWRIFFWFCSKSESGGLYAPGGGTPSWRSSVWNYVRNERNFLSIYIPKSLLGWKKAATSSSVRCEIRGQCVVSRAWMTQSLSLSIAQKLSLHLALKIRAFLSQSRSIQRNNVGIFLRFKAVNFIPKVFNHSRWNLWLADASARFALNTIWKQTEF